MAKLKPFILILGASSFLAKPLVKQLEKKKYSILCQSTKNLKNNLISRNSETSFIKINYLNDEYDEQIYKNCSFIVNFVNASVLTKEELIMFRSFLKNVLFTSNASLIHISTSSVYGNCKNAIISESSKCSPKNRYQKIKLDDEYFLQSISKKSKSSCFILRPTEIIGNQSLNARKFIRTYISSSFLKRLFIKSLYGKRISHFLSSKYLIDIILKILEGKTYPDIYLVSQDENRLNNFLNIFKILDSRIYKNHKIQQHQYYILPLNWLFKIIYRVYRSNQIPPYSKFISNKPIIDPKKYYSFEKDLIDHINYIIES